MHAVPVAGFGFGILAVAEAAGIRAHAIDRAEKLVVRNAETAGRVVRERRMRGIAAGIDDADDDALAARAYAARHGRTVPDRFGADEARTDTTPGTRATLAASSAVNDAAMPFIVIAY